MHPTNPGFQVTTGFKFDPFVDAKTARNITGSGYDVGLLETNWTQWSQRFYAMCGRFTKAPAIHAEFGAVTTACSSNRLSARKDF